MAKQILIKFTIDGAIVQAESSAANIRQGDSNGEVSIIASVTGRTTAGYLARVHFERPDGKKANVVMTPSSEYSDRFVYVCESAWFFAVPGQAKVTVTITDSGGAVSAQGTYEFAVAATTVDVIDSTLTYDEAAALEGLIADVSAQVSALSKLTNNPVTVAYSLTRNAFRTVLSGYTAEAFGDLGGYIIKKNGASLTEQDVLEYMSVMFGTETVPFGTPTNESGRQAILFLQNGEMYRIIYSTSGGIYDLYALRLSCSAAKLREELGQSISTAALTAGGQNTKITANDNEVEIIDTTTKNGLHVGGGFIYFVSLDNKFFLPNNAGGASSDAFILASKAYADSAAATVRSALQAEIDTVNATQNVVDIVGTKANLLAYDTTNLQSGDKIEVLVDESQNGANTIYSWNGSAWVLVGSKAPYYSISQIDSMLLSYATSSWVDSNYMSLTKGGYVNLAEDPASANTVYFGAHHGTKSSVALSDNRFTYKVSDDSTAIVHDANRSGGGLVMWSVIDATTSPSTMKQTKLPFRAGSHFLAFQDDLDAANAKIAKNESDIQYLYRQVIGGGDLVTQTDSGVSLTSQPFPLTVSPKALLDYVGGMCQKVNQLVDFDNDVASTSWGGAGTYSITNKKISVVVNASQSIISAGVLNLGIHVKNGHKYYVYSSMQAGVGFFLYDNVTAQMFAFNAITSLNQEITNTLRLNYYKESLDEQTTYTFNLAFVDLTAIYGAGNEPTSTSDPRIQWLMSYLSSHPEYDAGSIITAPVTMVVSKGFNLWDEETKLGYYSSSNGQFTNANDQLCSVNPIAIKPNTTYFVKKSNILDLRFYDADMVYISGTQQSGNTAFTSPNNAYYLHINLRSAYGTTYNHDICINVSNASLNGTYMPYRAPIEYPIPAEVRALEGYGWGFDAECNNHASYERKKNVKMIARVDLGSLNWIYSSTNQRFYAELPYAAGGGTLSNYPQAFANVLCAIYANTASGEDKSLFVYAHGNNKQVYVYDSAYNGAPAFTEAMQGKYLYYEVAEPVETDISEYIDSDVIVVSAGGHLEFENEDDMGVPYSATYQCEANP